MKFLGYERADGSVGIRNHILIIGTTCSGPLAERIAGQVEGAVAIRYGRCSPTDVEVRQLVGIGQNPNIGAVLAVSLNCESVPAYELADYIAESGKPTKAITIKDEGSLMKAFTKGVKIAQELARDVLRERRKPFDISNLVIGLECGGSDATSGIAANPAVGVAVDKLIDAGATVIFSEPWEAVGCEEYLAQRAANEEVAKQLREAIFEAPRLMLERIKKQTHPKTWKRPEKKAGFEEHEISRGNIEGGLTTTEEKSLGAIRKAGSRTIQGVLETAQKPPGRGLWFMNTVGIFGTDLSDIVTHIAAGAQMEVFTTGRGSCVGCAVAPILRVVGNPYTCEAIKDIVDVDASTILKGEKSIKEVGERVFNEIIEVASGKLTKAELLGFKDFQLFIDYYAHI